MLASCSWAWGCPEVWLSHPVRLHWYSVFLPKVVASVCTQDIDLQFFLLWFNYFVLALEYLLQRISLEGLHLFPFYGIVCICLVLEFFFCVCVRGWELLKLLFQFCCFELVSLDVLVLRLLTVSPSVEGTLRAMPPLKVCYIPACPWSAHLKSCPVSFSGTWQQLALTTKEQQCPPLTCVSLLWGEWPGWEDQRLGTHVSSLFILISGDLSDQCQGVARASSREQDSG